MQIMFDLLTDNNGEDNLTSQANPELTQLMPDSYQNISSTQLELHMAIPTDVLNAATPARSFNVHRMTVQPSPTLAIPDQHSLSPLELMIVAKRRMLHNKDATPHEEVLNDDCRSEIHKNPRRQATEKTNHDFSNPTGPADEPRLLTQTQMAQWLTAKRNWCGYAYVRFYGRRTEP
ncbi:hypothetical protein R1sor_025120 [Riccia sorocarpa]|uniref:Uncharacterized protein n=1 Tax=Riccia sorocarpa TaxID=122646 RepID=A0ABD3GAG2_9MARC